MSKSREEFEKIFHALVFTKDESGYTDIITIEMFRAFKVGRSSNQEEIDELRCHVEALRNNLTEAIKLMEDVRSGDYTPDSFTVQPWELAREATPSQSLAEHDKALIERIEDIVTNHKWGYDGDCGIMDAIRNMEVK